MKKILLSVTIIVLCCFSASSQDISKNALGLRIGDRDGFGTAISYQLALGNNNRLETGLGWNTGSSFNAYKLTAAYQWVWHLDGNFNWYAGLGGGIGLYNYEKNIIDDKTFVLTSGTIGIEYDFDMPLLFSLDFRPELSFGKAGDNFDTGIDFDIALSLRYQF